MVDVAGKDCCLARATRSHPAGGRDEYIGCLQGVEEGTVASDMDGPTCALKINVEGSFMVAARGDTNARSKTLNAQLQVRPIPGSRCTPGFDVIQ
jgi:hypothetical protein